jgi:acetyl-CoA synthetase
VDPDGKGLKHYMKLSTDILKNKFALRFIRKDRSTEDFTYSDLKSAKFVNVLKKLKIKRGTCFLANGRIPELYVTALGTLKYTAVFVLYFLYLA